MKRVHGFIRSVALISAVLCLGGCGWFGDDEETGAGEELPLPELNIEGDTTEANPEPANLQISLKPGQRFPLQKTVVQMLFQETGQGQAVSQSRLESWLEITVRDVQPDRTLMWVRYLAVQYAHDIAGRTVVYDSRASNATVPPEAALYHGLVNNEFGFWLGADNRIVGLEGFNEFLLRCVDTVPESQRPQVLSDLAARTGDEGLANFVDGSIGILPVGEIREGDEWQVTRNVLQPQPMQVLNTCVLKRLQDEVAEIEIVGQVQANRTRPLVASRNSADVQVTGGHTFGFCTVRRASGLPVQSELTTELDLMVTLPTGQRFQQRKRILTTIKAFESSGTPVTVSPAQGSGRR